MKHLYASKKMAIESDLNYKCDLCGYETTSFQSISGKVSLDGVGSYCGDFIIFPQLRGHIKFIYNTPNELNKHINQSKINKHLY